MTQWPTTKLVLGRIQGRNFKKLNFVFPHFKFWTLLLLILDISNLQILFLKGCLKGLSIWILNSSWVLGTTLTCLSIKQSPVVILAVSYIIKNTSSGITKNLESKDNPWFEEIIFVEL